MDDKYDDTLIDLPLDDLNNSLDDSEVESEASDYSTARSTRTHSFSDDITSVDSVREDTPLTRDAEDVSLDTVKSDTPLAAKESDSGASSSSGSDCLAESITPSTDATTARGKNNLQQENKDESNSESVVKASEDIKNNSSGVEERKSTVDSNLSKSPSEEPESSIPANCLGILTGDSISNSTTTADTSPSTLEVKSQSRLLENGSSVCSDNKPSTQDAGSSSAEHPLTTESNPSTSKAESQSRPLENNSSVSSGNKPVTQDAGSPSAENSAITDSNTSTPKAESQPRSLGNNSSVSSDNKPATHDACSSSAQNSAITESNTSTPKAESQPRSLDNNSSVSSDNKPATHDAASSSAENSTPQAESQSRPPENDSSVSSDYISGTDDSGSSSGEHSKTTDCTRTLENIPSVSLECNPDTEDADSSTAGNSATTNSDSSTPKEESQPRPLEDILSVHLDNNLATNGDVSSSAEHESILSTLTTEDTVVKRRSADSARVSSRPLSDVSDIQIESTWFVQGPRLEDGELLGDETSNGQEPTTQDQTNLISDITDEVQILIENQRSEATTEQEATSEQEATTDQEATTEQEAEATLDQEEQYFEETTTEVITIHNLETTTGQQPSDSNDSNMGDNSRLEEKLKQFRSQARESPTEKCPMSSLQLSELDKQRRRNLIFDEERFEETFLKCLICREIYNETDKLPKMLHCHHTFCMDCLYQMYRVEGEFRQSLTSVFRGMPMTVKIQCPTCREGIIISEAELRRLPNDHTIMELLSFVTVTGKSDISYCPKHQMQPLNFFCEPCIMPVCCDCTVIDHKESKGHRVVNVDEAMKKYTPILEETLKDIRTEKASLAIKREAIESAQDDLDRVQTGITDQIRLVFNTIREVLDERERELHDVAEGEVDRKRAILNEHLKSLSDREGDLNSEFNSLQQAKDDKDLSHIFTGHKSARELIDKKVHIPTNSTQGFSITFQYSSRSDSVIKQQVANLGDIIFHSN